MKKILELRERRAKAWEAAKSFLDSKRGEDGLLSAEDTAAYEKMEQEVVDLGKEIERLENELKMISYNLTKGEQLESVLTSTFKEIEDITDVHQMTNTQLKRIIQKIEVDKEGNVDIYLRLLGDLGLDSTILISDNLT